MLLIFIRLNMFIVCISSCIHVSEYSCVQQFCNSQSFSQIFSRLSLKSLQTRVSFAFKNVYPLLINPFHIILMPITSQLAQKSYIEFRIKLYQQQNYWTQLYLPILFSLIIIMFEYLTSIFLKKKILADLKRQCQLSVMVTDSGHIDIYERSNYLMHF